MLTMDPNTPPVGRQPFMARLTPSKPYPWYGSIPGSTGNPRTDCAMPDCYRVGGDRFTVQQLSALEARGLDPATVETIHVRRQATDREVWYGLMQLPPVFAMECPVLSRRPVDGAVKVISPSGDALHVRADGWVKAPRTRPRMD